MKKILFVCLGNICRSPMAEFLLKDMVKKLKIEDDFFIESRATSSEEVGNPVHYGTRNKLNELGISTNGKTAQRLTKNDYDSFDYIIGMDNSNIRAINRIIQDDKDSKVYRLLDFSDNPRDIEDPWYTGDFDTTYLDIKDGLDNFLHFIGY